MITLTLGRPKSPSLQMPHSVAVTSEVTSL